MTRSNIAKIKLNLKCNDSKKYCSENFKIKKIEEWEPFI